MPRPVLPPGPGRPKGQPNKATTTIRELTTKLFDDAYWTEIKKRLSTGKVAPAVEVRLLAYAFGEPTKVVKLDGEVTVRDKRGVLAHLPDDVVRELIAKEAFDRADDDETVN